MNKEQSINSISIEKTRPQSACFQSAGLDYRYCPSPSTCDSGIYSNAEVPSCGEELIKIDLQLDGSGDENQKLILARQIITKLKNELQCLSKSEKWYRNELKVQKKSRLDTLEKLYVNERDFLKTNQNLQLECQKLRVLCNQLKNKNKKEKELWLKQLKKDRKIANQDLERNVSEEATNYTIQKSKKIIEEHETLIDVLRKQKHNLLTDLQNLTSEKDGKIMILERKCAILEKENWMLVEKCKTLIIANQKLREIKEDKCTSYVESINNNEIVKLQTLLNLQNLEINNFKSHLLKLDKYKIENEKLTNDLNQFKHNLEKNCEIQQVRERLNEKEFQLFEIDKVIKDKMEKIEELQRNLLKASEEKHNLYSDFSTLMHKILKIGDEYLKEYELDFDSNNFNFSHLNIKSESELKPDFSLLKFCHKIMEKLNIKLNVSQTNNINKNIKSQELLPFIKEFKNIFDEKTILVQISTDVNNDDKSIKKHLAFNIEETIQKNELLYDIFQQNFDKTLCNKSNFHKFQEIFKGYNSLVLNQNNTTLRNVNNQSGNPNLKFNNDCNQTNINIPIPNDDLNKLKTLLVLQQEEHEKKINRHQIHVRCLMRNIKSCKKKFESLNNKYLILLQKYENLEKEIKEKNENGNKLKAENYNLQTIVINVKIENQNHLKVINNLQYKIKSVARQLKEVDTQKRINNDLKNNLTNLINDYKTIIKNNQMVAESVNSNINYDKIYELIYKSNNYVPNTRNLFQSVHDIKNDVKIILQNKTNLRYNSSILLLNKVNDEIHSNLVEDQRKSLMDELKEACS